MLCNARNGTGSYVLVNLDAAYCLVELPGLVFIERKTPTDVQTTPPLFDLLGRKAPGLLVEEEAL